MFFIPVLERRCIILIDLRRQVSSQQGPLFREVRTRHSLVASVSAFRLGARGLDRPQTLMTQVYGPAVRRKRISSSGDSGLASMYPAFDWGIALRAIMDISTHAISLAERP